MGLLEDMKMCFSKKPYENRRAAEKHATKLTKRFNVGYTPYECRKCGQFHLTTNRKDK